MRIRLLFILCLGVLLAPLHAQDDTPDDIPPVLITGVWARPALMSTGGVSKAYMTIENTTDFALQLTHAAAWGADEVQLYETQTNGGEVQMRHLPAIDLEPGAAVALEPGGLHLMLLGLQRDLSTGDALSLELTFEQPNNGEALTLVVGVPVLDEAPPASDFVVLDAWARPTALESGVQVTPQAGMHEHPVHSHHEGVHDLLITSEVTAVYLRMLNRGTGDHLTGALADVAGVVEIHETQMQDGVMRMRPTRSIALEADEVAVLEPGGLHIMLMDVQRGLVAGDAIMVTLLMESGLELPVAVPVRNGPGSS